MSVGCLVQKEMERTKVTEGHEFGQQGVWRTTGGKFEARAHAAHVNDKVRQQRLTV